MLSDYDVAFGGLAALLSTIIWLGYLLGRPSEAVLYGLLATTLILLPLCLVAVTRQERTEKLCKHEIQYWEDKGDSSTRLVVLRVVGTMVGCIAAIVLGFTGVGSSILPAVRVTSFFGASWVTASTLLRLMAVPLLLGRKGPDIILYERGLRYRSQFILWSDILWIRQSWSFISDEHINSFVVMTSHGRRWIRVHDLAGFRQTLASLQQKKLLVMS